MLLSRKQHERWIFYLGLLISLELINARAVFAGEQLLLSALLQQVKRQALLMTEQHLFHPFFQVSRNNEQPVLEVDGDLAPWGFVVHMLNHQPLIQKWRAATASHTQSGFAPWNFNTSPLLGDSCLAFAKDYVLSDAAFQHYWPLIQGPRYGAMPGTFKQRCLAGGSQDIWCVDDVAFSACLWGMLSNNQKKHAKNLAEHLTTTTADGASIFIADLALREYFRAYAADLPHICQRSRQQLQHLQTQNGLWLGTSLVLASALAMLTLAQCQVSILQQRQALQQLASYVVSNGAFEMATPLYAPLLVTASAAVDSDFIYGHVVVRSYLYSDFRGLLAAAAFVQVAQAWLAAGGEDFLVSGRVAKQKAIDSRQAAQRVVENQLKFFIQQYQIRYQPGVIYAQDKWWQGWPLEQAHQIHHQPSGLAK